MGYDNYARAQEDIRGRQRDLEMRRNAEGMGGPGAPQAGDYDKSLNELAEQAQVLEIFADRADREADAGRLRPEEQAASVTYRLNERTSLPSRNDQQLIQIAALEMDADFYRLAVPVLTPHVYTEAGVVNTGGMVLLAGPVSSYLDGQFVGHGRIATVAAGERFSVGFGIDTSLRAARELMDKTDTTQGGNRVSTFTYRLTIENFADEPAAVRLLDRLPTTDEGTDVRVSLLEADAELSDDPRYQQTDRRKGILRWDVEVPANATGTDAMGLDYQFRMEYDRQMSVTGLPLTR
jgi:uncharacterized protein (TIGR02231 family)